MNPSEVERQQKWERAIDTYRGGDPDGAIFLFQSLVAEGSEAALAQLGLIHEEYGAVRPQDYEKAFHWYKRAIDEADDLLGYVGLGRLFLLGRGVAQDFDKALWYYSQAEKNEMPVVHLVLGRMHHLGRGVPRKDLSLARRYYEKAYAGGNVWALSHLGHLETEEGKAVIGTAKRIGASLKGLWIAVTRGRRDPRLAKY